MTIVIIIITAIFSFQAFRNPINIDKFVFYPYRIKRENEWYRFVSHGLIHGDWNHLLFNMFTLYFFGRNIETAFQVIFPGRAVLYFLLLYIGALIFSSIPSYFKNQNNPQYRALGASGAVSAILYAFILLQPWSTIYVFIIPMKAIIYGVLFLVLSAYMSRKNLDNIGHDAHFWGASFGFAFTIALQPSLLTRFIQILTSIF